MEENDWAKSVKYFGVDGKVVVGNLKKTRDEILRMDLRAKVLTDKLQLTMWLGEP